MSVLIHYWGRFGNNIFQYAAARLFAEKNGLWLLSSFPHQHMLPTAPVPRARCFIGKPTVITDETLVVMDAPKTPGAYVFEGYFHRPEWYEDNLEKVKSFFLLPKLAVNHDDIAMHVRLGDYRQFGRGRAIIDPLWYRKILQKQNFRKLYVVTEEPNLKYLAPLMKWKPEIRSGTQKEDFEFLMSFERVLCSNSTYCWWAAILGHAKKLWTHTPWIKGKAVGTLAYAARATPVEGGFWEEDA